MAAARSSRAKAELGDFLRRNPFPRPYTLGFYYREKMRAIHAVTPDREFPRVLELGGGESGLTGLLFPGSEVVNLDADEVYGRQPANRRSRTRFVCGDATRLPFADESFDAVTMFDVLEHVPDHAQAAAEAVRVLRPDGATIVSAPNLNWRFPFYRVLSGICPTEQTVMDRWGHVRRGYELGELARLFGAPCSASYDFINRATVVSHDVAFSSLPGALRRAGCMALWPLTWMGYVIHDARTIGTETASCWRKGPHGVAANPVSSRSSTGGQSTP